MTLVPTDESKNIMKKYEELWSEIRVLIRSKADNSDNYSEKHTKITFDSDDDLPLNKTLGLHNMIKIVRAGFHEKNKYYPQAFLDEYLHKL